MTWLVFIAVIVALILLRQRLVVILGVAAAMLYLLWGDGRLDYVVLDIWAAADKEVLLSIPLFILAGNIMAKGSIASRLIDVVRIGTSRIPGGLGIATVLSCAVFSAISGSSTVTLIAVGAIMYPALLNAGYSRSFALGLICAGGTLGIIIPPSIPLILYGVITETSIADLFIAGVGPALLLVLILSVYTLGVNWKAETSPVDWPALWDAGRKSIFAAFMPVLILGGIYSGYFTPTESAAVAVFYAALVEVFIHREMRLRDLEAVTYETAKTLGSLVPVLMLALSINTFMAFEQVPQNMVEAMSALVTSKTGFLLLSLGILLLFGCFMDISSAILILGPLLTPIAESYGIDPVHFGIIMIVNLEIGYLTPPLGLNLIIAMGAFREPFWTIAKAALPFILLLLLGLVITTFWPDLSLFLLR
ncbi:TRAP transporter large permease [Eilatimonas milleporae]|uniref:TRAP transporter large permease protein n=1 Tax=Eilatimonas milleporae TaxID=911205 RepID=A0A3M0CRW7_9PROT|nr:TRAP transporter large permease [Eilatimonas milleporae]RMB12252.1 C4-dicarboxylate transporter DctM subunit [Eilatimonas milleporae]